MNELNVAGCGSSIYPYVGGGYTVPKVKVVEETVTETFDENGKLIERIKKTVTRYEETQNYQATWFTS